MAVNDVALTSAMRTNLLLLQGVSDKLAKTQNNLATGNKINSALDGPTAYFAAKGLSQRAGDLTGLKDAMGQAINTIKAADKGITAIESLVEQARGLTTAAYGSLGNDTASRATRKTLANQFNTLKAQIDKIAEDSGYAGKNMLVGNGLRLDSTGTSRTAVNSITGVSSARTTNVVATDTYTIKVTGDSRLSANSTDVANAEQDRGLVGLKVSGKLSATNGNFGDVSIETRGAAGSLRTFTLTDSNEARTIKYFDNTQKAETATTRASRTATSQVSTVSISGTIEQGDVFTVSVKGQIFKYTATSSDTAQQIGTKLAQSIQAKITSGALASSDIATAAAGAGGTIVVTGGISTTTSKDFTITSTATNALSLKVSQSFASGAIVSFTVDRMAMEDAVNGGNGVSLIEKDVNIQVSVTNIAGTTVTRDGNNARGQGKLSSGENAFAFDSGTVRMKVDDNNIRLAATVAAAKNITTVQQTNASTANDLTVQFNERNSNSITVLSQNVKTDGQGLRLDFAQNDWTDRADIDKAVSSIDFAKQTLRQASQSLSTNLNIITTREQFTKDFSNVLVEGANKLTLADQNEEGANMLMLQTRQQLGTIALSLANQSQQSILRLF
ncbi:Flagellin-like hook-associated protein FlgL [Azospirillaceae bacterium]